MKNKTKKLFFSYIGVSVLAITTPITIVCGESYHTNKIANSKRTNRAINKEQKVPNFVNTNLYQNTNYGKSTITINWSNIWGPIENSASSAFNSFWNQLNLNLSNSSLIPENINWTSSILQQNTNINGALNVWIQSYCSSGANSGWPTPGNIVSGSGNVSNSITSNFSNNKLEYNLSNFFWDPHIKSWDKSPWWFWSSYPPLQLQGNISFNGINSNGNITFTSNNQTSIFPASTAASIEGYTNTNKEWGSNSISNPEFQFSTNSTWTITLPFNMQQIQSNIKNAISNINLQYYEFQQQWETGLVDQIDQDIKGCIPSYMSNCFNISPLCSTVNYGNGTSGTITTTLDYTDGQNQTVPWTFTTNITAPAQPSNQQAYNLFKKTFSQPITLFSDTSNNWDSNEYWGKSTVPSAFNNQKAYPKEWSYVEVDNSDQIYYNGLVTNTSTWCTNQTVLNNYINTIFNMIVNELQQKATVPSPDPFSKSNPISIKSITFQKSTNGTYQIKTELTFNNGNFNKVKYINNDSNPSPWAFYTSVSLAVTQYFYSGDIMDRLIIQALNMPIAGSFKTQADEGIKLTGSTSTQTSGSSNGSGYVYYGTYLYFSSAVLTFTGSLNEDETLYINNQPIQVINNQFTYDLNAPNVFNSELNNTNSSNTSTNNSTSSNNSSNSSTSITKTYNIEIYRNNVPIAGKTIIITRGVPNVNFKWYAWDPSNKPWQEKLITQNLSNGKANEQYNPLINPNTGSINQILWVNGPTPLFNNQTPEPYFADPLQSNNELYPQNESVPPSDLEYIADAEVFNKGVEVNWNTNNANVYREGLTLNSAGQLIPSANPNPEFNGLNYGDQQQIYPNNSNNNSTDYFSYSGLWEYTTKSLYNYDGTNYLPNNSAFIHSLLQ